MNRVLTAAEAKLIREAIRPGPLYCEHLEAAARRVVTALVHKGFLKEILLFIPPYTATPKGKAALRCFDLGLTVPQVMLLKQADRAGGTLTSKGGTALSARRLKTAGLLESLDPTGLAFRTTARGMEALAAWKEVYA